MVSVSERLIAIKLLSKVESVRIGFLGLAFLYCGNRQLQARAKIDARALFQRRQLFDQKQSSAAASLPHMKPCSINANVTSQIKVTAHRMSNRGKD
jgi:hypothetical protein